MGIAHLVGVVGEVITAGSFGQRSEGAEGENHLKPVAMVKVLEFFEELIKAKDLSPIWQIVDLGLQYNLLFFFFFYYALKSFQFPCS